MPAAHAIVEHRLEHRMRLRVPARRSATDYFTDLVACLSKHPDVEEVHANPLTAGVLVLHRGRESAILDAARDRGLITLDAPVPAPKLVRAASTEVLPSINAMLAVGLGVLGFVQVLRGRMLGPASELLWNTYVLFGLLRGSALMPVAALAILVRLAQGPVMGSASSFFFYALAARERARRDTKAENDESD